MPKIVLPLLEYLKRQAEEILSPDNRWFAGETLHHSPSDEEAAEHYAQHGGAADFAERFESKKKGEKSSQPPTQPPA